MRRTSYWLLVVLVCGLVGTGGLTAQEEQAPQAATPEEPVKTEASTETGVVTGDRVNVRTGASVDAGHLFQTFRGSRVEVVGRQGEWVEIRLPKTVSAWVASQFVEKAADGDRGVARGDRVSLRAGGGPEFDRVGLINRGYPFVIEAELGDYYKVKPVPGATAFIHRDYITMAPEGVPEGGQTGAPASQPAKTVGELEEMYEQVKAKIAAEQGKEMLERQYSPIIVTLVEIINQSINKDPFLNLSAQKTLAEVYLARRQQAAKQMQIDREKRIEEILAEIEKKHALAAEGAGAGFMATGIVDKFSLPYPPATHKLVEGERIKHLLYSDTIDLSAFVGKEVSVAGEVRPMTEPGISLIKVTRIEAVSTE